MTLADKRFDPSVGKRFPFRMSDVSRPSANVLVQPHWHDHLEFIKIVTGPVTVSLDNHTFVAQSGDIIYVNSRCLHSVISEQRTPTRLKGFIFDRLFVTNLLEGFDTRQIYQLFIATNIEQQLISVSHPLWQELDTCIQTADEEYANKDICYEMAIKSCIYRMVTAMLRHYKRQMVPLHKNFTALQPALAYIEENYAERLTLTAISRIANMSPSHFSRTFKDVTGMTLTAYITSTRIQIAKQMLVNEEWSITEIADKTGFCDIHYFGKVFKEATGVSPLHFKHESRRQDD